MKVGFIDGLFAFSIRGINEFIHLLDDERSFVEESKGSSVFVAKDCLPPLQLADDEDVPF